MWCGLAIVAFLMGGQFFRHYWVILAFPLGTTCAAFVSLVSEHRVRYSVFALMLLVPALSAVNSWTVPHDLVGEKLSDDTRLTKSERVGEWFEANRQPGENIMSMCVSAALYGNVSTDPPYPYLWFALIPQVPGAYDRLVALFEGEDPPTYVAEFQPIRICDWSGRIRAAIAQRYRPLGTVEGIAIYARTDRAVSG
jgi:hypothetical protein